MLLFFFFNSEGIRFILWLFLGCLIKRSKTWVCVLQQIKGLRSKAAKHVCGSILIDYSKVFKEGNTSSGWVGSEGNVKRRERGLWRELWPLGSQHEAPKSLLVGVVRITPVPLARCFQLEAIAACVVAFHPKPLWGSPNIWLCVCPTLRLEKWTICVMAQNLWVTEEATYGRLAGEATGSQKLPFSARNYTQMLFWALSWCFKAMIMVDIVCRKVWTEGIHFQSDVIDIVCSS